MKICMVVFIRIDLRKSRESIVHGRWSTAKVFSVDYQLWTIDYRLFYSFNRTESPRHRFAQSDAVGQLGVDGQGASEGQHALVLKLRRLGLPVELGHQPLLRFQKHVHCLEERQHVAHRNFVEQGGLRRRVAARVGSVVFLVQAHPERLKAVGVQRLGVAHLNAPTADVLGVDFVGVRLPGEVGDADGFHLQEQGVEQFGSFVQGHQRRYAAQHFVLHQWVAVARGAVGVVVVEQGRVLAKQIAEVAPQLMRVPRLEADIGEADGGEVDQSNDFQRVKTS